MPKLRYDKEADLYLSTLIWRFAHKPEDAMSVLTMGLSLYRFVVG